MISEIGLVIFQLTVFNTNIDTFSDDTMTKTKRMTFGNDGEMKFLPNTFVNDDTDGMSSYIENTASFTMIKSMWHTFLNSTITLKYMEKIRNAFIDRT